MTVTLSGTALVSSTGTPDPSAIVTFCGQPATIVSQAATALVVVTPAAGSPGYCTVQLNSPAVGLAELMSAYRFNLGTLHT